VVTENHEAEETANSKVELLTHNAVRITGKALEERSIPREEGSRATNPALKQLI
jgi:hypothetical protein